MIVSKIEEYKFDPKVRMHKKGYYFSPFYITIRSLLGRRIFKIKRFDDNKLIIGKHTFEGQFDYLKISRNTDSLVGFRVELFCQECGDAVYTCSAKLPSLFIIKTDFHVTKD